jgi:hypothetical protein
MIENTSGFSPEVHVFRSGQIRAPRPEFFATIYPARLQTPENIGFDHVVTLETYRIFDDS